VVPIINENDSVAVEELRFGDNDRLSSEVAQLVKARLLILLTSADGLMASSSPASKTSLKTSSKLSSKNASKLQRIPVVTEIRDAFRHVTPDKGEHSTGGMQAKLQAVQSAVDAGIETIIAHGRKRDQIAGAIAGKDVGSRFPVCKKRKQSKS
jgi:glutamate 5-kinase